MHVKSIYHEVNISLQIFLENIQCANNQNEIRVAPRTSSIFPLKDLLILQVKKILNVPSGRRTFSGSNEGLHSQSGTTLKAHRRVVSDVATGGRRFISTLCIFVLSFLPAVVDV